MFLQRSQECVHLFRWKHIVADRNLQVIDSVIVRAARAQQGVLMREIAKHWSVVLLSVFGREALQPVDTQLCCAGAHSQRIHTQPGVSNEGQSLVFVDEVDPFLKCEETDRLVATDETGWEERLGGSLSQKLVESASERRHVLVLHQTLGYDGETGIAVLRPLFDFFVGNGVAILCQTSENGFAASNPRRVTETDCALPNGTDTFS